MMIVLWKVCLRGIMLWKEYDSDGGNGFSYCQQVDLLMEEVRSDDHDGQYWQQLGKLLWAASAGRPDMQVDASLLSGEQPSPASIESLNKAIRAYQARDVVLRFVKLDRATATLTGFVDANHPKKEARSAQLGEFVWMEDKFERANPIHWGSFKSKPSYSEIPCWHTELWSRV